MPSLASTRSIDPTETFQPLGPAVKPEPQPQPLPVNKPTSTPGIVEMPDGKLATELPLPRPSWAHDSLCFEFKKDFRKSLASSPAKFQQEFMADLSDIERRITALHGAAVGGLAAECFGTRTGRVSSSKSHITDVGKYPTPASAATTAMHEALKIASQNPDYPWDGTRWLPHDPARDKQPVGARWAVLRNGSLRHADNLAGWSAGSYLDDDKHPPEFDVVGWK